MQINLTIFFILESFTIIQLAIWNSNSEAEHKNNNKSRLNIKSVSIWSDFNI